MMKKRYLVLSVVLAVNAANAKIVLNPTDEMSKMSKTLELTGLIDSRSGQSVNVTIKAIGANERPGEIRLISWGSVTGFGVFSSGGDVSAALTGNEELVFTFSKDVELGSARMLGLNGGNEALAWWIDLEEKNVVAGKTYKQKVNFDGMVLKAGQTLHISAYEEEGKYPDTRTLLSELSFTVPAP